MTILTVDSTSSCRCGVPFSSVYQCCRQISCMCNVALAESMGAECDVVFLGAGAAGKSRNAKPLVVPPPVAPLIDDALN